MRFIIGTKSVTKLPVARRVIAESLGERRFTLKGHEVRSGVPKTPWNEQTYRGAVTRARACRRLEPSADFWIGLESGLVERFGHVFEEAWACVITTSGEVYYGFSSGLKVPDFILEKMETHGRPHWHVMRTLRRERKGVKDTWGEYTGQKMQRTVSLEEALRNALIQIFAPAHSYYHRKRA